MDMIISVPNTTLLGLRTPTRRGREIMNKPKYGTRMVKMWKIISLESYKAPLKYITELYQKYMPESKVHSTDKANSKRDTFHTEDTYN